MLLLSTDSLRGYGLNRIFELAKTAGYDGIDLVVDFGQYDTLNADYIKKLIKDYGMPVHSVSAPKDVAVKRMREMIELGKNVEAKVVILQPPKIHEFKLSTWMKKEVPKLREKYFISIALENAPAGTYFGFIPEHALSNTNDLKSFKHVSLDTARVGEKKQDLIRAYNSFKKYLVHIHLSNLYRGKKYAPPQEGIMPLESFLTKLKQDKYPGAISMKILPKHLGVGEDEKVLEELGKAKKYYDKYYTNVEITEESDTEVVEDKE